MKRIELEKYLSELLKPENFDDYCPNGLQIEGKEEISKIIFLYLQLKNQLISHMLVMQMFWLCIMDFFGNFTELKQLLVLFEKNFSVD